LLDTRYWIEVFIELKIKIEFCYLLLTRFYFTYIMRLEGEAKSSFIIGEKNEYRYISRWDNL